MNPADMAMRRALDEGARYGSSSSASPSTPTPLLAGYPEPNLTSFELRTPKSPESSGHSLNLHVTRHLTLHKFRQFQQSPVLSSSPVLDYKRVRRKQSFAQLARTPSTSSLPSIQSFSAQSFVPSLLPPLPVTPVPRQTQASPSLSSTVDTIQSTPTHSPIHHDRSVFEQRRRFERIELIEPIRTKRKFPLFKPAKRLPHCTALHLGETGGRERGIWEVHAVIVDPAGTSSASGDSKPLAQVNASGGAAGGHATRGRTQGRSSGNKGRSVRFAGIEEESNSDEVSHLLEHSVQKEPSRTSSFSISKFSFPKPPGHAWAGTFGHLGQPGSPTSPATLHYEGTSFDVVNPHQSLLLGSSDFETPAEIDGLLNDYFNNRDELSNMAPYDNITGERSESPHSSNSENGNGNNGNGRQRVLYQDAVSAHRNITGGLDRPADSPQPSESNTAPPQVDRVPNAVVLAGENEPPNGMRTLDRRILLQQIQQHIAPPPQNTPVLQAQRAGPEEDPEPSDIGPSQVAQRGSSLYPHSQRSDPFNLTISDLESTYQSTSDAVGGPSGRSSYYAGDGALYDQEDEDFADENDATQNTLVPDTTLTNIVSHYMHARPAPAPLGHDESAIEESSTSIEAPRSARRMDDVFRAPTEAPTDLGPYSSEPTEYMESGHGSRMDHPPSFAFGRRQPTQGMHGPPRMPAPVPTTIGTAQGLGRNYSSGTENPSTDRTYGNTGQLLQLTPRPTQPTHRWPSFGGDDDEEEEEDKENAPEHSMAPRFRALLGPTPRSSAQEPDDENDWYSVALSDSGDNITGDVGEARPSQDSYADTSVFRSLHRQSLQSPSHVAQSDEERVKAILQEKLSSLSLQDEAHRADRMKELEELRQRNPEAHRRAVESVAAHNLIVPTPPRPTYSPQASLAAAHRRNRREAQGSASSETRGLLDIRNSPQPLTSAALEFSPTANTFQTAPRTPGARVTPYSPLTSETPTTPASALLRNDDLNRPSRATLTNPFSSIEDSPVVENIEMSRLRRDNVREVSRAAMSSQTELQPLRLVQSNTASIYGSGRRTNTQLAEAEPGWTMQMDRSMNGALAQHIGQPVDFGIQQRDGTVERVRLLQHPADARNMQLLSRQKNLTRPYYILCLLCPISALVFGLGGLDGRIRRTTDGSITEMDPSAKRHALWFGVPLGTIVYTVVVLFVVFIDVDSRR